MAQTTQKNQKNQKKKTNTANKTTTANGKKPAARKTVAPTPKKQPNPVVGFCITGFITLLLLFLLIFKDMAFFGKIMRPFMCGLIGTWGLILLPAYLLNLLITWFKDRRNDKVAAKWMFSTVNFLCMLMLFHRFSGTANGRVLGADMWALGKEGYGTGLIGGNAYAGLATFIGEAPTITVLILLALITLPFLFDSNPIRVARHIINGIRTIVLQISDEDVEDAAPPVQKPRRTTPRQQKVPARVRTANHAPVNNELDDDLYSNLDDDPRTLPEQAEINRTRKPKKQTASTAAYDGYRTPQTTADSQTATQPEEEPVAQQEQNAQPQAQTEGQAAVTSTAAETAAEATTEAQTAETPQEENTSYTEQRVEPTETEEEPKVEREVLNQEETVYTFPPATLLTPKDPLKEGFSPDEVRRTSELLVQTMADFGVRASVVNTCCGPTVTRYEIAPDAGVRVRQIANLSDDIALHLAATSIRMEAPIPGKAAVGIEIPNKNKNVVRLRELIETEEFKNSKQNLLCCLGMDVVGTPVFLDIEKMPHLLIAGATGMGKSVCINSLIVSLLYRANPNEVKLILIDPKKVEFSDYSGIPHLLVPVVTEPKKAAGTLNWAVLEMEKRFSEIQDVGAKNLEEYNEMTADDPEKEYIPQVVIVIDELADLMMTAPTEVETSICRLAQKARAAGMYLIIGTQRPSVDVITGLIKANIPSRIACKVASQVDSRTILDVAGAEKLMGRGDMLYNPVGILKPRRVQGAFVEGREVISVCTYIKQAAQANYSEDVMALIEKEAQLCGEKPSKRGSGGGGAEGGDSVSDAYELQVIELALECDTISTSLIQRRLSIGYSRAARIIDKLEQNGIVGPFDAAAKKRKVLITKEDFLKMKMDAADKANATEGDQQ